MASGGGDLLVSGGGELQVESTGIEWWPLVISMLWKRNREDRDEKTERERDICDEEREKVNKIIII